MMNTRLAGMSPKSVMFTGFAIGFQLGAFFVMFGILVAMAL